MRKPWAIGPPKGLSRRGPLDVDVYPLAVAGQLGEGVDRLLGHLDRRTEVPEFFGRERLEGVEVIEPGRLHGCS